MAHIGAYCASKAYLDNDTTKVVEVNVDMATALPVNQYNKETANMFADKFLGSEHTVTVYMGIKKIKAILNFTYVKVIPEGVPVVFYLQSLKKNTEDYNKVVASFIKNYQLSETDLFKDKRILHVSIGEGTTEFPLTEGINFNPHYITGTNNGVGHATNEVLQDFISDKRLVKFSRQDFSNALKDRKHKYHLDTVEYVQTGLEDQAIIINDIAQREVGRDNNNVDYICVYGGGSILMKEYLQEQLELFAKQVEVKVLYIPKEYAVTIEALGLYVFANSDIFKVLKKSYIER